MRRILSVLMENEPGALSRVVGLFSQRGYNIDTLCVAPTDDNTLSRLTLTRHCDDSIIEQISKHLNKLIDVVKLVDLTRDTHVERELILIKVKAENEQRDEIKRIVDIFHGHVIDMTDTTYTLEVTGDSEKIDAVLKALEHITMVEVVRSGQLGMGRGDKGIV